MPPAPNVSHTWSATRRATIDELVGPGRPRPGHRRLQQVAVVVQLVAPLQIAVPRALAGAPEHGVEVAVGLLRRGDHRRQARGTARSASADPERPTSQAIASISL